MENLRLKGVLKIDQTSKLIEKVEPYDDLKHTAFTYLEKPEKYSQLIKEVSKHLEYRYFKKIVYGYSKILEPINKKYPVDHIVYFLGHEHGNNKKNAIGIRLTNSLEYKGYIEIFLSKLHYFSTAHIRRSTFENV